MYEGFPPSISRTASYFYWLIGHWKNLNRPLFNFSLCVFYFVQWSTRIWWHLMTFSVLKGKCYLKWSFFGHVTDMLNCSYNNIPKVKLGYWLFHQTSWRASTVVYDMKSQLCTEDCCFLLELVLRFCTVVVLQVWLTVKDRGLCLAPSCNGAKITNELPILI